MFGIGTSELILILVIMLIFLGPKKLPQIAHGLGRAIAEFRRASSDVRDKISSLSAEVAEHQPVDKAPAPPPQDPEAKA